MLRQTRGESKGAARGHGPTNTFSYVHFVKLLNFYPSQLSPSLHKMKLHWRLNQSNRKCYVSKQFILPVSKIVLFLFHFIQMNFMLTLFSTHFIGVFNGPPTLESWKFRILRPELDSLTNLDPILKTKISYSIGSSLHHCFHTNFQGIQMLSTFQKNLLALLLLLDLTYKRCNINLVCETHKILFFFRPCFPQFL